MISVSYFSYGMLGQLGGAPLCPCCEKRVYFNEEKNFAGKKWHKSCFICSMSFLNVDAILWFSI